MHIPRSHAHGLVSPPPGPPKHPTHLRRRVRGNHGHRPNRQAVRPPVPAANQVDLALTVEGGVLRVCRHAGARRESKMLKMRVPDPHCAVRPDACHRRSCAVSVRLLCCVITRAGLMHAVASGLASFDKGESSCACPAVPVCCAFDRGESGCACLAVPLTGGNPAVPICCACDRGGSGCACLAVPVY